MALLEVQDLKTQFTTDFGVVKAVDGISFHVDEHEIIGIVGESGCGKSVTQLSVMQLIKAPGEIVGGEVIFEGQNLLGYGRNSAAMRSIRGAKISMIFQEPLTSLNPVFTVGRQLTEMLELHLKMKREAARQRAIMLLKLVSIPDAERRISDYPHQFSGGMRQRIMIAMALSCDPRLVIADEPTTALDVTTQAQVLEVMVEMVKKFNSSLVIVTHNLGIVARYVERIYVMYAGRIVESGTAEDVLCNPLHPYTRGLLKSVPRLDEKRGEQLVPIEGMPPDLIELPPTCAFAPRCTHATEECLNADWPSLQLVEGQHYVACHPSYLTTP